MSAHALLTATMLPYLKKAWTKHLPHIDFYYTLGWLVDQLYQIEKLAFKKTN